MCALSFRVSYTRDPSQYDDAAAHILIQRTIFWIVTNTRTPFFLIILNALRAHTHDITS